MSSNCCIYCMIYNFINYELCFISTFPKYTGALPFEISAGSSRIRLILRARISAIRRRIARHFRLPLAIPSKIDATTLTEVWKRSARSIPIGRSAPRRPPTSADTPASRKSAIKRDTCPATIASTTSRYSVAVSRGRSTGSPAIGTWPDRHPLTTVDCPAPRRRATSSPPPNVCWRRHPLRRPPPQRPVSARLIFLKTISISFSKFFSSINVYILHDLVNHNLVRNLVNHLIII